MRLYYQQNIDECCARARQWREQKPEKASSRKRQYRKENREKICEYKNQPKQRAHRIISTGVWKSFKYGQSGLPWESLVDYTAEELRAQREAQLKCGISWDYNGEWQIDHIRPVSDFNLTSTDDPEFRKCWSLWNLQPLFAEDNMSKGAICEELPLPLLTKGR